MRLDTVDGAILAALQENARMSLSELARRSGVSLATAHWRLKKLLASGVLEGFDLRVNYRELGLGVTAFVRMRTKWLDDVERTIGDLRAIDEVEEVHVVAGDFDLLVKVRAADTIHLQQILIKVHHATGYIRASTEICLSSPLERTAPIVARGGTVGLHGGADEDEARKPKRTARRPAARPRRRKPAAAAPPA